MQSRFGLNHTLALDANQVAANIRDRRLHSMQFTIAVKYAQGSFAEPCTLLKPDEIVFLIFINRTFDQRQQAIWRDSN